MMNALRTETENPGATHKLVCGCDILSQNSQSSRGHYDSFGNQVRRVMGATPKLVWGCGLNRHPQYKNTSRLNPYRYAAREWLSLDWSASSALGLSDNRARFYDPTLASFLQEDPLWNSNPYTYVGNNPLNFVDPHGLAKQVVDIEKQIDMTIKLREMWNNIVDKLSLPDFIKYSVEREDVAEALVSGIAGLASPISFSGFTKHGLEQAVKRKVPMSDMLDAIKKPVEVTYRESNDTFRFVGNKVTVVLNRDGKVVTIWSKGAK